MRPSEIIDSHVDLLIRLGDETFRQSVTTSIAAEVASQHPEYRPASKESSAFMRVVSSEFASLMEMQAKTAYCYRVTPEMVDMVEYAADSLDDLDAWDRSLAPTGAGLVRFDRPVNLGMLIGDHDREVTVEADWLLWGPGPDVGDGKVRTAMFWFTSLRGTSDWAKWMREQLAGLRPGLLEEAMHVQGPWLLVGWDSFVQGRPLGPPRMDVTELGTVAADTSLLMMAKNVDDDLREQRNDARIVHALWLMLQETITIVRDEVIERPARRRAVKMKIPARVSTIALRRAEYAGEPVGETVVEWQHRWIVRRHSAWRKCGPDLPGAEPYEKGWRRRVSIAPYEKGPKGAPLVVTDKVYDLRR